MVHEKTWTRVTDTVCSADIFMFRTVCSASGQKISLQPMQ